VLDLFKLASVERGYTSTSFSLAGDNVSVSGLATHQQSFRYSVNGALSKGVHGSGNLMDTLFVLANMRPWPLGTKNDSLIMVDECPECAQGNILIHRASCEGACPHCGSAVYAADVLKLWKEDSDDDFEATGNRVMSVCEHLMLVRNLRQMFEDNPYDLGRTAFIVDGPLAVSGIWTQWLHKPIMQFLYQTQMALKVMGLRPPLIVGLSKTGKLVDHAKYMGRYITGNKVVADSDDYRARYVGGNIPKSGGGFGAHNYYGQNFIYWTATGAVYVFDLPYPFSSKDASSNFRHEKSEAHRYSQLGSAVALIDYYRSDEFENAVVPVVLAHKFTAISAGPGGAMIDALVSSALAP